MNIMSKLFNLYVQDMKLLLRNSFVWLMMGTIIIFLILYHFVITDSIEHEITMYFVDNSTGQIMKSALEGRNVDNVVFISNIEELEQLILDKETQVGIVFEGTIHEPRFTIVHGENMREENVNLISASLRNMIINMAGVSVDAQYSTKFLADRVEPIPQNKMLIPIILTYEVVMFSFWLSAVFMFQEKAEGSIKAYRITPTGTAIYITSKTLAFITKGVVYALLLIFLTLGFKVNFLALIPILMLGIALFGFIGMSIATFFSNLSEYIFVAMGVLIISMLPVFTILIPSFSPFYIEWIPSFPALFSIKEILFPLRNKLSKKEFLNTQLKQLIQMMIRYPMKWRGHCRNG